MVPLMMVSFDAEAGRAACGGPRPSSARRLFISEAGLTRTLTVILKITKPAVIIDREFRTAGQLGRPDRRLDPD